MLVEDQAYHVAISGLPLSDGTVEFSKIEGTLLVKDKVPPSPTFSNVNYADGDNSATLTLTGSGFTTIAEADTNLLAETADGGSYIDWQKLAWNLTGSGASVVLDPDTHISTAVLNDDNTITIVLNSVGRDALYETTGFAASGGNDDVTITNGFTSDYNGNLQHRMEPKVSVFLSPTELILQHW